MFIWLAENLGNILVILVLAAVVAGILLYMGKQRKKGGGCSYGGNCGSCGTCCACHPKSEAKR